MGHEIPEGAPQFELGTAPPGDASLPLDDLDRHIGPLRRTVAFALHHPDPADVRFFESNATRWLRGALRLPIPDEIRDLLATIGGRLSGYDDLPGPERLERLRAMNQSLTRLDALLGLPLHGPITRPPRPSFDVEEPEPEADDDGDDEGDDEGDADDDAGPRDARGRRERPTDDSSRALRLGDPRGSGRALADFGMSAAFLASLAPHGVVTLADLLLCAPIAEEILRPLHGAGREIPPGRAAVGGRVRSRATRLRPDGSAVTELIVQGAGPLRTRLPDAAPAWLIPHLAPGSRVVLVGTFVPDEAGGTLTDAEWVPEASGHAVHLPIYGLAGVDERVLRSEIRRLVPEVAETRDSLPRSTLDTHHLPPIATALAAAHLHGSARPEARRRLALEELLTAFLGLGQVGDARQRGIQHPILHNLLGRLSLLHGLDLQDPQQRALEAVKRDLRRSSPMLRLLTGEGGAGQGTVAFGAAVLVAESKSQVLCVGPDRATMESRFLFAEPLLREVGLVARLLDDEPTRPQRDALRRGEVHVAFGLDTALDAGLEFRRLGLVVAEESGHLRGTARRLAAWKPPRPDVLVVAPSPVPSEALPRAYADHAISEIHGLYQREATCEVLSAPERMDAYQRVATRVRGGEQAWVLFPMVRGNDALDMREAARLKATLEAEVFQGLRVGLFHGTMTREDRHRTYDDFRHRRFDVLLSTSIIEEGPVVPDASVCVVEHADLLSRERMIRIRAHLARARREAAAFFILGEAADTEGTERLRRLVAHEPFAPDLADAVEVLDYPEDAAPLARFRWTRPAADRDLVLAAHALVADLLADDPAMRLPANAELGRAARWFWPRLFDAPVPIPEVRAPTAGKRRRRRRKRK